MSPSIFLFDSENVFNLTPLFTIGQIREKVEVGRPHMGCCSGQS